GLEIIATDINEKTLQSLQKKFGYKAVKPEEIYEVDCDIFSPSAIGGVLNNQTIPKLMVS
ncbi:MAG: leucine dehydrogenase, partial [Deltaproteobacteria bacterium]|nr:leucine dehydrogenase [Deltaproteobacteria bacterium]